MSQSLVNRKVVVVFIAVVVGLLHCLTGPRYRGPFPAFVNGYMTDVLLPFACAWFWVLAGSRSHAAVLPGGLVVKALSRNRPAAQPNR